MIIISNYKNVTYNKIAVKMMGAYIEFSYPDPLILNRVYRVKSVY